MFACRLLQLPRRLVHRCLLKEPYPQTRVEQLQRMRAEESAKAARGVEQLRLQYLAREERYVLDGDREELRRIRVELDGMRVASASAMHASSPAANEPPCEAAAEHDGMGARAITGGAVAAAGARDSVREDTVAPRSRSALSSGGVVPAAPRAAQESELQRLKREKEDLLKTVRTTAPLSCPSSSTSVHVSGSQCSFAPLSSPRRNRACTDCTIPS